MTTKTKPKAPKIGSHWPPLTHIIDRKRYPNGVKDGDKAICGATLAGLNNPDRDWPTCKKCVGIAKRGG